MDTMTVIERREPGTSRRSVLLDTPEEIAATLMRAPGEWHLISYGDKSRHGTMAQTAFRIRKGRIAAFARDDGTFEAKVSTDRSIEERVAPVELFARWLPRGRVRK